MRDRCLHATATYAVVVLCLCASVRAQHPAAGSAGPVPDYEPPMLDLLFAPDTALPSDLHVAVRTERFRAGSDGWSVPVVVAVDASDLATRPAEGNEVEYCVDVLGIFVDAEGRTVAKLSRSARFHAERAAALAGGRVALACQAPQRALAPGSYRLRLVVFDPTSRRGSVVSRTFTLPEVAPASAPSLSSLVVARYTEPAIGGEPHDPFLVDAKTRVVPDASGRVSRSHGDRLAVFSKLYGMPGVQYLSRLEFILGSKVVMTTPVEKLPAIPASGELATAPVVPVDALQPGAYRVVLKVFAPGSGTPVAVALTPVLVEE